MEFSRLVAESWFDVLQTIGIIVGFFFTAYTLYLETKARRVTNHIALTDNHREIWAEVYRVPALKRVLDRRADLREREITQEEEIFVNSLILQMSNVFYAQKSGMIFKLEGLRRDICWILSLPIPQTVWEKMKVVQNDDFVEFVEACLNWK